jgi:sulfur carrier protein
VKVLLRNPRREVDVPGPATVDVVLARLEIHRDSVIVIRGDELVPGDTMLSDDDQVEVRPVISGGALEVVHDVTVHTEGRP